MDLIVLSEVLHETTVRACASALSYRTLHFNPGACYARFADIHVSAQTKEAVNALCAAHCCDAAWLPPLKLSNFRVLAMDMDSTLITVECIDEIANAVGKGDAVRAITAAAMRGEITDYASSLVRRVGLLAGTPMDVLAQVYRERVKLSPGAASLVSGCQRLGIRTLLVSGGFSYFTTRLQQRLKLEHTCANELIEKDGQVSGEVVGPRGGRILDAEGKAREVQRFCREVGCTVDQAIVVGDGANDLAMMRIAGLSVAYRAKPAVRAEAQVSLSLMPLDAIFGLFTDHDWTQAH